MFRPLAAASLILALAAPAALANEGAIKARQGQFQMLAINLGVLGTMAQGRTPYDAAAAQEAADNIFHLTRNSQLGLWPEGSDNGAAAGTRALPGIWSNNADFLTAYAALQTGAEAMQAAAGTDLAALQGAMGGLAGACQACHQQFRAP
jgi:cytochrome c556